jgi:hypothetical protein
MEFPPYVWSHILSFLPEEWSRHYWRCCFDAALGQLVQRGVGFRTVRGLCLYVREWELGPSACRAFMDEIRLRLSTGGGVGSKKYTGHFSSYNGNAVEPTPGIAYNRPCHAVYDWTTHRMTYNGFLLFGGSRIPFRLDQSLPWPWFEDQV